MNKQKTKSRSETFKIGCFAGFSASVLLQPFDLVKTRLQGQVLTENVKPSILRTTKTILKENGILGLWRGVVPTAVRATLGPGLYFVLLEEMQALEPENDNFLLFFQGATARAIAGTILCPMTVVKTRYEMSRSSRNPSVVRTLFDIARHEKLKGLFSGLWPMLFRDVPQSGLYLYFFGSVFKPLFIKLIPSPLSTDSNITACSAFSAASLSTAITVPADVIKTRLQMSATNENVYTIVHRIIKLHGIQALFSGLTTRIVRRPIQLTLTWTVYSYFRNDSTKRIEQNS
mmetsp:Transcript_4303/g.5419  ORF Transcript_4303/g.5419 Transcript_4303/m.5419 type:complete len:288 (-) Transcript_4303:1606-2469(-)